MQLGERAGAVGVHMPSLFSQISNVAGPIRSGQLGKHQKMRQMVKLVKFFGKKSYVGFV